MCPCICFLFPPLVLWSVFIYSFQVSSFFVSFNLFPCSNFFFPSSSACVLVSHFIASHFFLFPFFPFYFQVRHFYSGSLFMYPVPPTLLSSFTFYTLTPLLSLRVTLFVPCSPPIPPTFLFLRSLFSYPL